MDRFSRLQLKFDYRQTYFYTVNIKDNIKHKSWLGTFTNAIHNYIYKKSSGLYFQTWIYRKFTMVNNRWFEWIVKHWWKLSMYQGILHIVPNLLSLSNRSLDWYWCCMTSFTCLNKRMNGEAIFERLDRAYLITTGYNYI